MRRYLWLLLFIPLPAFAAIEIPISISDNGDISSLVFQGVNDNLNAAGYVIVHPSGLSGSTAQFTNTAGTFQYTGFTGSNFATDVASTTPIGTWLIWYFNETDATALSSVKGACQADTTTCEGTALQFATIYHNTASSTTGWYGSATSTFDVSRTYLTSVRPFDNEVVSSTTPTTVDFSAIGYVKNWTTNDRVEISYYRNSDLQLAIASPSLITTTISLPIPNIFDSASFAFQVATSSIPFTRIGDYTATWTITRPSFTFLGFTLFTNTLFSTTTRFTVASSTEFDLLQRSFTSNAGNYGSSTETSTANDCAAFHLSACLSFLFAPSADSMAFVRLSQTKDTIMRKPPFGYFTQISSILSGAATSTASTTPTGIETIAGFFSPLRTTLAILLYFVAMVWVFRRVSKFDFQA